MYVVIRSILLAAVEAATGTGLHADTFPSMRNRVTRLQSPKLFRHLIEYSVEKKEERRIVYVLAMTAYGEVQVQSCTLSCTQHEISGAVSFTTKQLNTKESRIFPIEWEVERPTAPVCTLWR